MKWFLASVAVLFLNSAPVWSHEITQGDLVIDHPWARPSLGASPNGVAYMIITNKGEVADRLRAVRADVAKKVELHATLMDGDVMRMRPVPDGVEILPGQTVEIVPGGLHVMLMGLLGPLKEGDSFPLSLEFERAGNVVVSVHVELKPEKTARPTREHHH
jgi:periplasmic copper chaperone A